MHLLSTQIPFYYQPARKNPPSPHTMGEKGDLEGSGWLDHSRELRASRAPFPPLAHGVRQSRGHLELEGGRTEIGTPCAWIAQRCEVRQEVLVGEG